MPATTLFGREFETTIIDGLFDRLPDGGRAMVVRGDAGIGKSALLGEAARRAEQRGVRVLRTAGVEAETHLPFAGLHRLLYPVLSGVDDLPAPQRAALLAAFGMADADAQEPFLVALAGLNLLVDAAADAPLLLVVEDAHWLDPSTCDALAFMARRLESDPIVLLIAARESADTGVDRAGLPELRLEPLEAAAAEALLDARVPDLAPAVRARVLDEAAGNPLALVELPIASGRLADGAPLPPLLPLTARLERAFAARVSELPAATRSALLVAALDDGASAAEILAATAVLTGEGATLEALAPAVSVRLVEVDATGVRFRHPLVRSAIHQTAGLADRHAAHAALARALAAQPDRAVWHRAASIVGPDEDVAAELEAVAARAQARGGTEAAVAALERAAQLSAAPAVRASRLLRAAELAFELGRRDVVIRLVGELEQLGVGPLERPRLAYLRELLDEGRWSGAARVPAFVEIADELRRDGLTEQALTTLLTVGLRCWWANPDQATRDLVVAAAERMPVAPDHPDLIAILALAAPVERGAAVLDRLGELDPDAADSGAALRLGLAATGVGAWDVAAEFLASAVAGLRGQGRLALLAQALVSQAWAALFLGDWRLAMPAAEEAVRLAEETVQPRWVAAVRPVQAALAGLRGDEEAADALAAEAEQVLLPMAAHPMLALVQFARGITALGAGRHADAFDHLNRIYDPADIAYHPFVRGWAIAELTEAAVHTGREDAARAEAAALEPVLVRTRSPLLAAGLQCARPMLAADDAAEAAFQDGLAADLARWPLHRARLLLAYGVWLRRRRRVAESRAPLRGAREAFDALGAVPWGERARQELRASGEASRRRTPDAWDELTPQELQIAQMAAEGLTNREIGQRLYLSHRTVGSHLYRIFPKLGVTARGELRMALVDEETAAAS